MNTSGEVLVFFELMDFLLLNCTLGEYAYDAWIPAGRYCTIHISPNRSRFGDAVANFLAKDRDKNLKNVEHFPLLILPQ